MIHDIDIVMHLVNRPLLRIDAIGVPVLTSSADIANVRLTFAGGAVANITASRAAYKTERTVRIFQPDVYIYGDYQGKQLKVFRRRPSTDGGVPKISVDSLRLEERDALADEIESFLRCVAERGRPEVTGEDGLQALNLAVQISETIRASIEQPEAPGDPDTRVAHAG